jgi:hypothetical protein
MFAIGRAFARLTRVASTLSESSAKHGCSAQKNAIAKPRCGNHQRIRPTRGIRRLESSNRHAAKGTHQTPVDG